MGDTNLIAGHEPFTNAAQEILAIFEKLAASIKDPRDPQEKALADIARDLKLGVSPIATNVPSSLEGRIVEALNNKGIPFTVIDSADNGKLFIVRKKYEEDFRDILNAVELTSSEYAAEIADPKRVLAATKALGNSNVPVLEIPDSSSQLSDSIKHQFEENNISFAQMDTKSGEKFLINPNSLFSRNGKDLATAEFMVASTFARTNMDPSLTAAYDKAKIYDNALKDVIAQAANSNEDVVVTADGGYPKMVFDSRLNELQFYESEKVSPAVFDCEKGASPNDWINRCYAKINNAVIDETRSSDNSVKNFHARVESICPTKKSENGEKIVEYKRPEVTSANAALNEAKIEIEKIIKNVSIDASNTVMSLHKGKKVNVETQYKEKRNYMEREISKKIDDVIAEKSPEVAKALSEYKDHLFAELGTTGKDIGAKFDVSIDNPVKMIEKELGEKFKQKDVMKELDLDLEATS